LYLRLFGSIPVLYQLFSLHGMVNANVSSGMLMGGLSKGMIDEQLKATMGMSRAQSCPTT
jgi:hypothetical protein